MAIDSYLSIWGWVVISGLLAIAGLLITRRFVDFEKLRSSHDVGGYLLSVVGTLYAVLLGLVVVDSLQKFQTAREVTEKEANSIADVFLLASRLPEPEQTQIKKICIDYTNDVVNKEWKHMDDGKYSIFSQQKAIELIQTLLTFEPKTENQKALYPQMIADATQVWQNRRLRINFAIHGVPDAEWIVLILGATITVFFTYFFGLKNLKLQIIMTAMVAILIALNLVLLLMFGYPFSGDECVHSDAFHIDQGIFQNHIVLQSIVH